MTIDVKDAANVTRTVSTIDDLLNATPESGQTTKSESTPTTTASDQEAVGAVAVAHGANPTAVAAGAPVFEKTNRAGIPFTIGGHPNIITRSNKVLASDGAQTDFALVSVSAGSKIVVTQISAVADAANTVNVAVKVGFGAANVPTPALAGVAGMLLEGTFGPGGGLQKGNSAGIVAVGADAEDLRLTCGVPTGGALYVTYSYFTIES